MPQLIVALDSLDDDANYIHINDVKENVIYYCPCCKSVVKPRAYKQGVDYQMQPHFYHESGGCNEETYVHYICKNWLFDKGVQFFVNGIEYEVDSIETENTLHTSFGDYRPDIIVVTTDGKTFYFEIKSTNRKTELYAPKWDELGNDVVEVDVRDFINQKVQSNIPVFNLIYSDGECFIKSYTKKDYDEIIATRKKEWKRQDKLNYKIQWERLDWFWETLVDYKRNKNNIEDVLIAFENLDFSDKDFVMTVVKKMKCQELFDSFVSIINKAFWDEIKKLDISPYENVYLKQESPRIYYVGLQICHIQNCRWINSECIRKKVNYYGKEILDVILTLLKDDFCCSNPPCFDEILKIYRMKNLNSQTDVSFYLGKSSEIYCSKNGKNYRLNEETKYWNLSIGLFDVKRPSYLHTENLQDLLSREELKILRKEQHRQRMSQYDQINNYNMLTNAIIKKINNCKNSCWSARLKKAYLSDDILLEVNCKLPTNKSKNIVFYNGVIIISLREIHNKQQLFNELKSNMNRLFKEERYCFCTSTGTYERARLMMEDSNGK